MLSRSTVTAMYYECPEKLMCLNACFHTKSKFLGLSIGVQFLGRGERLPSFAYCLALTARKQKRTCAHFPRDSHPALAFASRVVGSPMRLKAQAASPTRAFLGARVIMQSSASGRFCKPAPRNLRVRSTDGRTDRRADTALLVAVL